MAFSCLLNRQQHYMLRGVLQLHSRYIHRINAKDQEISANMLGYNTWHVYDSLHSVKGERNFTMLARAPHQVGQKVYDSLYSVKGERNFTMQARAPHQVGQKVGLQLSLVSPGIILEPYKPPEPVSFLQRFFTRAGWKRTRQDLISEINTFLAQKDQTSLRKLVTENMYSIFKKEIKQREGIWSRVHWEMIEPAVKVQTLQARMIGVDKDNLDKAFVQVTLEVLTNQKFAAYDLQGKCVAGDIDAKVLVRDVWVFERSLFQSDARWRLCGRISL
ncbi:uncharacterized protein LOC131065276 isoform X2 [Cryptomeria japonica]|uniref:uncharacterized protein LOC131065276 isoform X2 n=1 Tax=Cryptomeria japonica TaxID=3369 RepID=UPI0025AD75A1|nr:uncharacterized protein LOC131065276 isoform X2 [Cryptomeria japonica]